MQAYKIRIPNPQISEAVQRKAFKLGCLWASGDNTPLYLNTGIDWLLIFSNNSLQWRSNNQMELSIRRQHTEISYQDFLRLGEPEVITQTPIIMSEIKLKCSKAPQRAKNITVGKEYAGILVNSDDTQVDRWEDAEYFQCVNNSAVEAKYRLSLFDAPEPPAPQFPTWEEIVANISVNSDDEVVMEFNGDEVVIFNNESLEVNDGLSCCGLNEINGIQSLHYSIDGNCQFDLLQDATNQQRLKNLVFKTLVNHAIEENSGAFRIFSLESGYNGIDTLMQEVMNERGGIQTEYRRSSSSSNNIKVFVINL